MHSRKCKAKHHPLVVCLLCNPIKFLSVLLIPILPVLESWSFFIFMEIFVYLNWRRNKHQSKFNQRILRLFKQRNKMHSGNLTLVGRKEGAHPRTTILYGTRRTGGPTSGSIGPNNVRAQAHKVEMGEAHVNPS